MCFGSAASELIFVDCRPIGDLCVISFCSEGHQEYQEYIECFLVALNGSKTLDSPWNLSIISTNSPIIAHLNHSAICLLHTLAPQRFFPLVIIPTKTMKNSSIIDNIITNHCKLLDHLKTSLLHDSTPDHFPIVLHITY